MKRMLISSFFVCLFFFAGTVRAEASKAEIMSMVDTLLDEDGARGASSPFNQVIKKLIRVICDKVDGTDDIVGLLPKLCDVQTTVTEIQNTVDMLSIGMTVTSAADLLITATVLPLLDEINSKVDVLDDVLSDTVVVKLCDIDDTTTTIENTIDTSLLPKVCTMLMSVTNIELLTTTTVIPKVCDILDTVTNLELCAPTPITQADVPFTIATSGHYCLAENVTVGEASALTITADGVTLDLNGYTVATNGSTTSARGILITSGASCVTVANGYIDGSGTAFEGICIDSTGGPSQNIILKNLVIKGFGAGSGTGVEVESVDNLTIERVQMIDNDLYGIDILAAATHVVVKDCVALGNATNYHILGTRILIQDSLANQAAFDGFQFGGSASDVCVVRCEAKDNGRNGFREDSGTLGAIMVRECSALGNGGAGFFGVAGGALGEYVSNFAEGNSPDYSDIDFTAPKQAMSYWENVDGSDAGNCKSTPIVQSQVPFTIATSGHYCLAENVTVDEASAITITADGVTLDLNGYTVTTTGSTNAARGILITSGASCVTVANGYIDGSGTAFEGICIDSTGGPSQNIVLKDLIVKSFGASFANGTGIVVESVDTLLVEGVTSVGNMLHGINLADSSNVNNVVVKASVFNGNSVHGAQIAGNSITIEDCVALDNGFSGFNVAGSSLVSVVQCEAKDNGQSGFREDPAGTITNLFFRENQSLGNVTGFEARNPAVGDYVSNFAENNTTDYTNVDFTAPKQAMSLWENVDGSTAGNCKPTPITEAIDITVSGHYCLANDLVDTLTISVSNVTLDLNGHDISTTGNTDAIVIDEGLEKITVRNGYINSTGDGIVKVAGDDTDHITLERLEIIATGTGIFVSNATQVEVRDCKLTVTDDGLCYGSVLDFMIDRVSVDGGDQGRCYFIDSSRNGVLRDCQSRFGTTGFLFASTMSTSTGITLINCQATESNGSGINCQSIDGVSCTGCTSYANGSNGFLLFNINNLAVSSCFSTCNGMVGIVVRNTENAALDSCVTTSNGDYGIDILLDTGVCAKKCKSLFDGGSQFTGFRVLNSQIVSLEACHAQNAASSGFLFIGNDDVVVHECEALSNGGDGFDLSATNANVHVQESRALYNGDVGIEGPSSPNSSITFLGNMATGNVGGDFTNIAFIDLSSTATASASKWNNVKTP